MKNILSCFALAASLTFAAACDDEHDDIRPGLYTSQEMIETFPGDTVLVTGTVSNYVGISSVTLSCESWGIEKVYDLTREEPTVFNYSYQLIVPQTATFDQTLEIRVCDKNGLDTRKAVVLSFLPDMEAPTASSVPEQVEVKFGEEETGKGFWNLNLSVSDDRALKEARIEIPGIRFDKTMELSGREGKIEETVEFSAVGSFPVTITVADASGNRKVISTEAMVILEEVENPFEDYPQMYVVDAGENPDDYVNGYYRYMDRVGEYQYQGSFYAAGDNTEVFFVPEKSMDGDLFGASPQVSSKLMNNNGYVVPVVIGKAGYYGIWIDLNAHTYSVWPLEIPADVCTEPLWMSGTGFSFGEWGASDEMTRTGYRYTVETEITDYTGDRQYYFYTAGWTRQFRADTAGNWWYEATGGTCVTFNTDYRGKVLVAFDTAAPWGTIKKIIE